MAEEIRLANGKALVAPTDITRAESLQNAVERVRSELVHVIALAYNASGYGRGAFLELDPKGIHVVHLIVNGQIDIPKLRARDPNRAAETIIHPIALPKSSCSRSTSPRCLDARTRPSASHIESF